MQFTGRQKFTDHLSFPGTVCVLAPVFWPTSVNKVKEIFSLDRNLLSVHSVLVELGCLLAMKSKCDSLEVISGFIRAYKENIACGR
jgi:hypothetical protein